MINHRNKSTHILKILKESQSFILKIKFKAQLTCQILVYNKAFKTVVKM